jgi:hypothetical protein
MLYTMDLGLYLFYVQDFHKVLVTLPSLGSFSCRLFVKVEGQMIFIDLFVEGRQPL